MDGAITITVKDFAGYEVYTMQSELPFNQEARERIIGAAVNALTNALEVEYQKLENENAWGLAVGSI